MNDLHQTIYIEAECPCCGGTFQKAAQDRMHENFGRPLRCFACRMGCVPAKCCDRQRATEGAR